MFPLAFIFGSFALVAFFRIVSTWSSPAAPGLAFTEAEVAFLFPAPLSRRALIHYKLLSAQFSILLQSLLLTLVSSRWTSLGGNAAIHAVGWWIIFSTLNLHTVGATFTVTRLIERGVSKRWRQLTVTSLLVSLIAAVGLTVWRMAPPLTDADTANPTALFRILSGVAQASWIHWLLRPVHWVADPLLAANWWTFFPALEPAWYVLAAHYIWVMRTQTSFEEGSIAQAEKRAAATAAMLKGSYRFGQSQVKARRSPFRLASSGGRPETAFLWKNLLSTRPYFNHRTLLIGAGAIMFFSRAFSNGSETQRAILAIGGTFALMMAGYTVLLGPQFARQDLRSDLANIDLLKAYPLRGWQVVLGELLTPIAILTGILWLALLLAALALGAFKAPSVWLTPGFRGTAAVCLALVMPLLCTLQLMVPNAATLLFPSWAQSARPRERGLDVMGQRLIFVAGQLLVIAIAVLPAVALGLLLWFAAHWVLDEKGATAVATLGVLTVLGLESLAGIALARTALREIRPVNRDREVNRAQFRQKHLPTKHTNSTKFRALFGPRNIRNTRKKNSASVCSVYSVGLPLRFVRRICFSASVFRVFGVFRGPLPEIA